MTQARSQQVSLASTPYYHCVCRCVRRAFLCGFDEFAGKNFEHRRAWVTERLHTLAQVFAIDIAAYAVMSNHYHLVLHIDAARAQDWTEREVADRWAQIFSWPLIVERYFSTQDISGPEQAVARAKIDQWRERLASLSWYMRCLNEHLARRANEEDQCHGRFWEGRFKSQAILGDVGLLTCMTYVDLNPIRAGMAPTPESSDHTSIQQRLQTMTSAENREAESTNNPSPLLPPLLTFVGALRQNMPVGIAYSTLDYVQLVDWAGRAVRPDKRGAISANLPPILARLKLSPEEFLHQLQPKRLSIGSVIGSLTAIKQHAHYLHRRFLRGTVLHLLPQTN